MNPLDTEVRSSVNVSARRSRHTRLRKENPSIWKRQLKEKISSLFDLLSPTAMMQVFRTQSEHVRYLQNYVRSRNVAFANLPCEEKFMKKITYMVLVLFALSSLNIYSFDFNEAYATSGWDTGAAPAERLVADDEGYLSKSMPTGERSYANREGLIAHKVEQGETVSGIAYMYGLRTATILDNNPELGSGNYLKAGKELVILPTDGYLYTVKKGDNLAKIAKAFKVEEDTVTKYNVTEELQAGQKLVLAGARSPEATRYIAANRENDYRTGAVLGISPSSGAPNLQGFVTPTPVNGRYSRGFTSWHPGLDISRSDKSYQPNVVAPVAGTIVKVRQTGWNGGYGTHVIIEREDGVQVLMAHFAENRIYVREGEQVVAGQIVGLMGTTGRSSGIHVHVEIIVDGVKRNPLNYFSI